MRVLITGGAGFVGTNMVAHLLEVGGYEIRVLDDQSVGKRAHLEGLDVEFLDGDIRDSAAVSRALDGVDAVVHLAADTRVMDSIADPTHNFETNVVGTFKLLEAMRGAGVGRIVNASTGGAILGEVPPPAHEEIAPKPISPYGASKLAVEGYLSAYAGAYGMSAVSLRFSNIYGPRSYHKGSVVAHFFKRLLKGEELTIYGDGTQVRDYLYAGDLVEGIRQALDRPVSGVFQLGTGCPTSLNELVALIDDIVGPEWPVRVNYAPFREGEIHTNWSDITKACAELEFEPQTSLEDGLKATWNWFLQKYPGTTGATQG